MTILKNKVIYYSGIPGCPAKQRPGKLILTREEIKCKVRGFPLYRIPLAKISKASVVKDYIHTWIKIFLTIDYQDENDISQTLKVRIRAFGWPKVLKISQKWVEEIDRLLKK
jgi:hypothetical protein